MNFDNIEDMGCKIFDVLNGTYYGMDESERGPMLYVVCSIFGSMNYHPQRAKDCDVLVIVPPALMSHVDTDNFHEWTYRGLPIDCKIATLSSLDVCESIELVSVIYDDQKSVMISKPTVSTQMSHSIENFYKVAKNKMNTKPRVRSEVSKKCSNSFVKAKKKLLVEKDYDPYISMKSLWHSIRMYDFASQYAKHGKVEDFGSCSELFDEIQRDYETHDDSEILELITSKYKPKQNRAASVFKLYFPK